MNAATAFEPGDGVPTLNQLVARLDKLASMPASLQGVLAEIGRSRASAASVAREISRDPPLTARILRVANSGLFARSARVSDVGAAVSRIGLDEVRGIVSRSAVMSCFGDKGRTLDLTELYEHGLAAALLTVHLARASVPLRIALQGSNSGLFAAGLLHQVGLFALDHFAPEATQRLWQQLTESGEQLQAGEARAFGFTHQEVGALLLQRWRLPPREIEVARWYHLPDAANVAFRVEVAAVHLASALVPALGLGLALPAAMMPLSLKAPQTLELRPRELQRILDLAKVEVKSGVKELMTQLRG